jgi:E3 ubiquitin-protein ligase MYCBP2
MPHVFASISNLARSDPHCSVQVLSFIQDMLPSVAALNNLVAQQSDAMDEDEDDVTADVLPSAQQTTSPHYAWVESDHPYKPAAVTNFRVAFAESVQWMSIEFDPRCGTAQMEDVLQIYIK